MVEHLEDRQLLSVTIDKSTMYYSNAKATGNPASVPQVVTLTNTGSSSINFTSATITGDTTDFLISSKPAANAVIPANGTIQVGVTFTAPSTTSTVTLHTAAVTIVTTDTTTPSIVSNLRALALTGYQGGPEPSLEQVVTTLYQIPFNDGFSTTTLTLPYTLNAGLQTVAYTNETVAQTFVKAGTGPVTVQPLATFGPAASVPFSGSDYTWGYYTPGSATATTAVYSATTAVGSPTGSDGQTVRPTLHPAAGATLNATGDVVSFDPGSSAFGIYGFFPVVSPVLTSYSQDLLNAATPNGGTDKNRRIRFWPLQNNGAIVPNAYVAGIEEATNNDLQDVVFVVTNLSIVPTQVTGVSVGGTSWTGAPYQIPAGLNQLNNLAFSNINQISISFSKDVNVASGNLTLNGIGGAYAIQSFSYNVTNYTATWTFTNVIGTDNLHLTLAGVTDTSNAPTPLDGNWTDDVSTFPSGDGTVGGNFTFGFNVLPLAVQSSAVGDGSVQRSSIHSFSVTFNQPVNFSSSSFTVFQATLNNGVATGYTNDVGSGIVATSSDNTTWTFTCSTGGSLDRNNHGFFVDGVYKLVLHGLAVTDKSTGLATLGSGDQAVSFANNISGGTGSALAFHVLYGDVNGDANVTNGDLNGFRQAFTPLGNPYNAAFDFDDDGFITNSDLNKFRQRFLTSFSY
jgi:hypothetical protein